MRIRSVLLAISFASASIAAHTQKPRDPIILPETTQKISQHIYVIPDYDLTPMVPNAGIIIGARGVLVVDPGMGTRNGKLVYGEAVKLAPGHDIYIVSTHVHPEHDLGANGFPASAKMIRANAQVKEIAEAGLDMAHRFAGMSAVNADLLKDATFRKADVTFDKDYTVDLGGGVTVKLIWLGPGHTWGDTVVFVAPDKVVFAGDLAMSGPPHLTSPHSSVRQWLSALDSLDALHPDMVVPSHGPLGKGGEFMAGYRRFFITVRDRTAELKKQGKTPEQITTLLGQDRSSPYFKNTGNLSGAVDSAYKEVP